MSSTTTFNLAETVELAKYGNKTAFQQLVKHVNNTVGAIALAITHDLQDSNDVSQLVFIKMWQQLSQLKNNDSLLPWVRQTTRYTAINYIRDSKKQRYCHYSDDAIERMLEQVCDGQQQDELLIKQQQNELVANLLEKLPGETREILILYYREEQNSRAVASLLEISESLVRKRLQRVREQLKEQVLAKYGRVLFATAPVGLTTSMALIAMTSPPAAATSLGYVATSNQTGWLGKAIAFLGGAGLGGIIAVMSNNLAMKQTLKNIDNEADISILTTYKNQSNIWMIFSCILLWLSYEFSNGWLMPVLSYGLFLLGLTIFINATNKITIENLLRQADKDKNINRKISRHKIVCIIGWTAGVGGGTLGLLLGLYQAGRFSSLF